MASKKFFSKVTEPIDQWLELQGLYRKHTAHDPSCLFRAVAEQVFNSQSSHELVRKQCVEFLRQNEAIYEKQVDGAYENYLSKLESPKEWGSHLELNVISQLYEREVVVFEQGEKPNQVSINSFFQKSIMLCASSENHYDSVYPKDYIMKAAFCQSLVYDVLYKKVFKLLDVDYAVDKMLHKSGHNKRDHFIQQNYFCTSSMGLTLELPMKSLRHLDPERFEGELNVRELLARGITPFPYKVAKALDPDIYRNIEFDVWSDLRREMKMGIAGGTNDELQIGVKCLVKIQPDRVFHAHIQEMEPNNGPVIVFVEELGEKCTVSHDDLQPLPKNQKIPWSLPYRQQRQFSSLGAKSPLLSLSDINSKWRKNKYNKSRKLRDMFLPYSLSPSDQFPNGVHTSSFQHDQQSNQMRYHEYLVDNCNYNTNTNSSNNNGNGEECSNSSTIHSEGSNNSNISSPDSCSSLNTCQKSSAVLESDQQPVSSPCSPALQIVGIPAYPAVCPDSSMLPRVPSPPVASSYILCNGMPQSRLQPIANCMDNVTFQPVNFFAQKSVQLNGSDLPFSDIPTLRFYYNLGHDFLRSGYMMWSNSGPTYVSSPPPPPSSALSSDNLSQLLPDSTVPSEDEPVPSCSQKIQPPQVMHSHQASPVHSLPHAVQQPVAGSSSPVAVQVVPPASPHTPVMQLMPHTMAQAVPPMTPQQVALAQSPPQPVPTSGPQMVPQMNVNVGWQPQHFAHGSPTKSTQSCDSPTPATQQPCEEYTARNETNAGNPCHPNAVRSPLETYNSSPEFLYYVVETDSVPYYNITSPYSYVIHPSSEMEMMQSSQVQPMQSIQPVQPMQPVQPVQPMQQTCISSSPPIMYHQPAAPPGSTVSHWVSTPDGVSQYTVAM